MELDNEHWKTHRYLEARIKALGMPLDEIQELLLEYEKSQELIIRQRNQQFAAVAQKIRTAKDVGAVLREFAEHVVRETRILGVKARDSDEAITDQIPDMDTLEDLEKDE